VRVYWRSFIFLISCWIFPLTGFSSASDVLTVNDTDINIGVHQAEGGVLAIWLPSEAGPQTADEQLAVKLARLGVEVWRVDLVEAHFLPVLPSSMDALPGEDIQALMEYARKLSGKKVLFITTGRGAIPVLRGLHLWQLHGGDSSAILGALLFSPKFYVETPDPGMEGEIMPIVSATNLPLYIIQPDQSPWYWKLKQTVAALEKSGSDVYVRTLHKARDRYFFRADATELEKQLTVKTPGLILQAVKMLDRLENQSRKVPSLTLPVPEVRQGKKDRLLSGYGGDPKPPPLVLADREDKLVDLKDYLGTVVLINFWASWCPPCVHEMPSMQRLKEKMKGKPFEILAVNMAEDKETVQEFLATKVKVDFRILFDADGKALQAWNVYAFPTSFVMDKNGLIRYALFGSIEWDEADIVRKIDGLTEEK
jgi:thiol-disulfide isomerase/thioredoxin